MKKIDLTFYCEEAISKSTYTSRTIQVELNGIDASALDSVEIAKCIDPNTFIEAYGEDELKEYIKSNYDWFA